MRLSTKSRYALEALLYMAVQEEDGPFRIRHIADETGISACFLEQIFFGLRKAGLLRAARGAKGGFIIARPLDTITVTDVIRATETRLSPVECVDNTASCKRGTTDCCTTRGLWVDITRRIMDVTNCMTLAMLRDGYLSEEGVV